MIIVTFTPDKPTKRTWRFNEVLDSEYANPKVGVLYVQKGTLGEMGYQEGDNLVVTIEIEDSTAVEISVAKPRRARRRS